MSQDDVIVELDLEAAGQGLQRVGWLRRAFGLAGGAGGGSEPTAAETTSSGVGSSGSSEHTQQGGPRRLRRLLALEAVQDPGNLGTLLRCAMAFGW